MKGKNIRLCHAHLVVAFLVLCVICCMEKPAYAAEYYYVTGTSNYLALRTEPGYNAANEIGRLNNGEKVEYVNSGMDGYWYVYASSIGKYGYVNSKYLAFDSSGQPGSTSPGREVTKKRSTYQVKGTNNYLALRTEPSYDAANEIGKLYEGDVVEFINSGSDGYSYVYSSKLRKYGYVNSNYLNLISRGSDEIDPGRKKGTGVIYTVYGTTNYLALRTEAAYSTSNEIGKLYNGETVEYINSGKDGYWYVYSSKLNQYGYVNRDYLKAEKEDTGIPAGGGNGKLIYTVSGTSNYLALRSAAEYNAGNEIGKLYNGDTVEYVNAGSNGYCYVYAPLLGKYGYVNQSYLK